MAILQMKAPEKIEKLTASNWRSLPGKSLPGNLIIVKKVKLENL